MTERRPLYHVIPLPEAVYANTVRPDYIRTALQEAGLEVQLRYFIVGNSGNGRTSHEVDASHHDPTAGGRDSITGYRFVRDHQELVIRDAAGGVECSISPGLIRYLSTILNVVKDCYNPGRQ